MSVNIPNHFTLEFNAQTALLRQIMGGKFRSRVMNGSHTGEGASPVSQFGQVEMAAPAGRFAPKNITHINVDRRWVYPEDNELNQLLDKFDLTRLIEDPKGPMAEAAVRAVGREEDRQIIAAMTATSQVGKRGASTEAFDTTNFQIASGSVGLTVDKLREARKNFGEANVDLETETLYLAIAPAQMDDLLASVQVTSRDFTSTSAMETGRVARFLGYEIFETNLLAVASSVRSCLAFVKSGVHFGTWMSPSSRVAERDDLASTPWQLETKMTTGATRLEQGRVQEILCTES